LILAKGAPSISFRLTPTIGNPAGADQVNAGVNHQAGEYWTVSPQGYSIIWKEYLVQSAELLAIFMFED
jgi:hypothetical protein